VRIVEGLKLPTMVDRSGINYPVWRIVRQENYPGKMSNI
jgi:hypothetical protein